MMTEIVLFSFTVDVSMYQIIQILIDYTSYYQVFGSILSATDPVAVVALLKTAGASPKLTMCIVGESLMNDGTAMVLFTLFYYMLQGRSYTALQIIEFFIEATLGSTFLGIGLGFIVVRLLY